MPKKPRLVTILTIISIWILYVHMLSPAPLLLFIRDYFGIFNNDVLLNQAVSIIYPAVILGCVLGGHLEHSAGTKGLFHITLFLAVIGLGINFIAVNYVILLIGRFIYGIGFGLSIPFIGSAIMNWYTPEQRYRMSTINGFFPFLGSLIAFSTLVPLYDTFGGSIKISLGIWAIPCLFVLIIWNSLFNKTPEPLMKETVPAKAAGKGLYLGLMKRKNIFLLCMCFICDFWCFSYLGLVQPSYIFEMSGGTMSEATAGLLSAFAMPTIGLIVCGFAGMIMVKTARRKPNVVIGQLLKFIGYLIFSLSSIGDSVFLALLGSAIFGMGTSIWLPSMYTIPTELAGMNSQQVGAAFGIISACGYFAGFVSPIVGGLLTNAFMASSGIVDPVANHVYGIRWSLFIFAFMNFVSFLFSLGLDETGPGKKNKQLIMEAKT